MKLICVQLVGRGLIGISVGRKVSLGIQLICADASIFNPVIQDDYVFSANGYNSGRLASVKASQVKRLMF